MSEKPKEHTPFIYKIDAYKIQNRAPTKAGVTFTILAFIGVVIYAAFLGYTNATEIQTTVSVLPTDRCEKAIFTCQDKKGCTAAAVGENTANFTGSGLLTTTVTSIAEGAKTNFYLCAGGLEGVHLGPSSDILSLNDGEFLPSTSVYNAQREFGYIATDQNPAKVIKADLKNMVRTAVLKLNNGEGFAKTSVLIGEKMYIGLQTGQVVQVDVSGAGNSPPTRVASVDLGGPVVSSTSSPDGTFGLFGVATSPYGHLIEVVLSTMTITRNVTLQATGAPSVLNEGQGHALVGFSKAGSTIPSPGGAFIQKIHIGTFNIVANKSLVGIPSFGSEYVSAGVNGGLTSPYVYFGTTRINDGQPAHIVRVMVSDLSTTQIQLKGNEQTVVSAVFPKVVAGNPPTTRTTDLYFAINSNPPRLIKVLENSFTRTLFRDVSNPGPNQISSITLSTSDSDGYVYIGGGTGNSPGRIKRYSPSLGLEEKWGSLVLTGAKQTVSNSVRIPPAPLLDEASVFLTNTTYINSTISLKIGFNAPLTPPTTLYPCELNTQERCCVVNGAPLLAEITESLAYSWIAYLGAVGGFVGIALKIFSPFLGVIGIETAVGASSPV